MAYSRSGGGALMKRISALMGRLVGVPVREQVGVDRLGNKYIRYNDGAERREVEWHAPFMLYDPNEVPAEWRMWLRKLRDDPPSLEELAKSEAASATLATKVAALEASEEQRRMRMAAMGQQPDTAGGPDMERLMGQVAAQRPPTNAGAARWAAAQAPGPDSAAGRGPGGSR